MENKNNKGKQAAVKPTDVAQKAETSKIATTTIHKDVVEKAKVGQKRAADAGHAAETVKSDVKKN